MARSLLRDAREARKTPGAGARYTRVPARLERTERLTAVEPAAQAA
jgi:hypothetical protein